ncbi:carbohydrate-binding protein [Chitinophaga pendula]|uniref:carbohydrate-binding protein n=1 Tax=Chitinophaga TaxID=79328 RepID=UPI000BAF70E3|nr:MULTISPECIES: carbohydrate-binding protein [Chitinophaga]ASZ13602.1 hypothetical protein CK934_22945 [Chitinophaga sp. MD30]UCJ08774.1 carbohydrate-binding protein [Chitinophaga pendula]
MKTVKFSLCALLILGGIARTTAQTVVPVGAGSYAAYPPAGLSSEDGPGSVERFAFERPIYVAKDNKKAIPTNDWWTDLVVSGNKTGKLWIAPLVVEPKENGLNVFFPNNYEVDAKRAGMILGPQLQISANGYQPDKAFAKDWSDWGLIMSQQDSAHNTSIDVTMAQGQPFVWYQTHGINPEFSMDGEAPAYLHQDGSTVEFPTTAPFIIKTRDRYLGLHFDNKTTAEIQGQQYVVIDLGHSQPITRVTINWENAFASGYYLQTSDDSIHWQTVFSEIKGDGNLDDISLSKAAGKYIRLQLTNKATIFGYSIWEMSVYNKEQLISLRQPVTVSSIQGYYIGTNVNDGNINSRWGSDPAITTRLVLNNHNQDAFFVLSALPALTDLPTFDQYACNRPTDTKLSYRYDAAAGKVYSYWNITTQNLRGGTNGPVMQGFLPHLYANAEHNIQFAGYNYRNIRGIIKTAIGNSFAFTYNFDGILPTYSAPFRDTSDAHPYDPSLMFSLLSKYSRVKGYGADTYWGGKDLVNLAKNTLIAKELHHQSYQTLKEKTKAALVDWLTYTPGEPYHYFVRYDRWGAIVGFNESYWSYAFTDNHFHYGYLILASALYGMTDPDFLQQYGEMIKQVAKQYANWDRADNRFPFLRTFSPWAGHSYAGGISSPNGNNQESSSESMQSWIGLFILGDLLNDQEIKDAAAFGYSSESYACLEYWFDWKKRNLPAGLNYNMIGMLFDQAAIHAKYFGGPDAYVHGIQYLPVNPGFKYLTRDTAWAKREYADMLRETIAEDGLKEEADLGVDWAGVMLGFRQLFDPAYTAAYIDKNRQLAESSDKYILKDVTASMTYFYTHADQNLGRFSTNFRTDFPLSSVFEKNGTFSHAVAYNSTKSTRNCNIYNSAGALIASFPVPAATLVTYPSLPAYGNAPTGCYDLLPASAVASSGNADAAIDGDPGSRWESKFEDPQQLTVDLGTSAHVSEVTLSWEAANAKNYYLLASKDSLHWDTLAVKTNMPLGNRIDTITNLDYTGRYLKMLGTARNTPWGYSIFECKICGTVTTPAEPEVILPALIQAEDYTRMNGVQTESCADGGGGENIGYIDTGDWMEYKIYTPATDDYQLKLRIASPDSTGKVTVLLDGQKKYTFNVPNTGAWQSWKTLIASISLPAGDHIIRLLAENGQYNVNWLDLRIPFKGFSTHIEAEDYTAMSGIQTEQTYDLEGNLNVGWIDNGDWMDYQVNLPHAGEYIVKYRVSAAYNQGGQLLLLSGNQALDTVNIPDTKGWQNWTTVNGKLNIDTAGTYTFRLKATTSGFNINWWEIQEKETWAKNRSAFMTWGKPPVVASGKSALKIYPNPASTLVHLLSDKQTWYYVLNVQGRIVKQGKLVTGDNVIEINGLLPGIYFIKVTDRSYKLMIE